MDYSNTLKIIQMEQLRLQKLKEYILTLNPNKTIRGTMKDLVILESDQMSGFDKITEVEFLMNYYIVSRCCSIWNFEYYENDITNSVIGIFGRGFNPNSLSKLKVDQKYREYYCEKAPHIDSRSIMWFLEEQIMNPKYSIGNNSPSIRYYEKTNDKNSIESKVNYFPYDSKLGRAREAIQIYLLSNKIRAFTNDLEEITPTYIEKWIETFYDFENGDPRDLTQITGYHHFTHCFKNERVDWTPFLNLVPRK